MEKSKSQVKVELAELEKLLETKYGYSWDFSSEICTIVESIIDYYGIEYTKKGIIAFKITKILFLK